MTLSDIFNRSLRTIKTNSPEILTGFSIAGVVGTAYLSTRSGLKAARKIDEVQQSEDWKVNLKENFKLTWKLYIPPVASGALTIACVVGASKASGRRTAVAVAAYSLTEKAFSEYKEHVIEEIGKNKEQKIRDNIAQDRVTNNPPSKEVVVLTGGNVLCCELRTGRYFRSDHETLRKAENDLNSMVINSYYCPLDEFYDLIGLDHTSESDKWGWDTDKVMELQFSTVLSPAGEPCLAFDYNYIRPGDRSLLA